MNALKRMIDANRRHFEKGGRLSGLHPVFDAIETVLFHPSQPNVHSPHVRDSLDLKRFMSLVIVALIPPMVFGLWNAGYQSGLATGQNTGFFPCVLEGLAVFLPMLIVSYAVGLFWEGLFAFVRKHPISEGFLVSGLLFPLTLPPTTPLWQVAAGITFGVVIGKEVFGGTGRNILNPALTARAFIFFAYPASMSGDRVWVAGVDAVSGATPLALAALTEAPKAVSTALADKGYSFMTLFLGTHPGSIGETSAFMCLLGAGFLVLVGVASWRIILGGVLGILAVGWGLNLLAAGSTNPWFSLNPVYHLVMGSAAFGLAYMATDPVTGPGMEGARWVYGFLIGGLTVLIRVFNPAYPEGVMLSILFMNLFSPLMDHLAIKARLKKRVPNV